MLLIFVFGLLALQNINSATDPKLDPKNIVINVVYPGASPMEVEQSVIFKIENTLQGIQGIRKVTSNSYEDSGEVWVKVNEKYDTDQMLLKVKNAVDGISTFPVGMEKIMVHKEEYTIEALTVTLMGDVSQHQLLAEARLVEDELLNLDGISKINFDGLPQPEIEIALNENKMRAYQLTFDEVAKKISEGNIDLTGGTIRGESEYLMIRTKQKKYFARELEDIVIRNADNGGIIYLKDIADLNESWTETPSGTFIDGQRAVSLNIMNNEYEDVEDAAKIVKSYIKKYNASHSDTRLLVLYDNSEEITSMKEILVSNGMQGFVLVLLFLSLFLNRRLSFWVALGIPISLFGMFIIAALSGVSFNTISLFGMIVVLGILVDDAVVIAESIYNHYLKGKSALEAAIDGTLEVLPSVFSGVLTTIIAFVFFLYLDGVMGQYFTEMAIVIIGALAFSLFEGTFILPGHVGESKALRKGTPISRFEHFFTRVFNQLRDKYFLPTLHFCLQNITLTISVVMGLLLITIGALNAGIIRQGDVASADGNSITVQLEMPPGTPPETTANYLRRIEKTAIGNWKGV